jgi:hypothetical protein
MIEVVDDEVMCTRMMTRWRTEELKYPEPRLDQMRQQLDGFVIQGLLSGYMAYSSSQPLIPQIAQPFRAQLWLSFPAPLCGPNLLNT